jgi:hypothetical protein
MLVSRMSIAPDHEQEFNRWYDQEHLVERVAIPGFMEARRYVALSAEAKYLALYTTENFEVLDGPAYRAVLQNQTQWSLENIARLQNPSRAICRVTATRGQGRGSVLGTVRVRSEQAAAQLRGQLDERLASLVGQDGIISLHLVESDPELSKPLGAATPPLGAGDWYILIDGTDPDAVARIAHEGFRDALASANAEQISADLYRLLWDVSKAELNKNS